VGLNRFILVETVIEACCFIHGARDEQPCHDVYVFYLLGLDGKVSITIWTAAQSLFLLI
jgi:hypothetical protein